MNELVVKIAELLDITVESAIKLYPVLREQFVVYKMTSFLMPLIWIAIGASTIYLFFEGVLELELKNEEDLYSSSLNSAEEIKEHNIKIRKRIKKSALFSLFFIVLALITIAIQYIYATDLLILVEFM